MNKVASITPIWNQEPFILRHFEALKSFDANFVILQSQPLGAYHAEHGVKSVPDKSAELLLKHFPHVKYIEQPEVVAEFGCDLFNQFLPDVQDYDLVVKLDLDMVFLEKDWHELVAILKTTDADCVRLNYKDNSYNYYVDYEHGLKDALEVREIIAFNPKKPLLPVLNYDAVKEIIVNIPFHHLRGFNKPLTTHESLRKMEESGYVEQFGGWKSAPQEIQ